MPSNIRFLPKRGGNCTQERSEEKRRAGEALFREADNFGRLPSFLLNPS